MRTTLPGSLVTTTVLLAALGACASPGSAGTAPDGFMTLSETQQEYSRTVADFPLALPASVTFPKRVQQPKESTIYQKGSGLVQAYQFWECAWMDRYLRDQGTHPDDASAALAQLRQEVSSVYRTQYVIDDDRNWADKALGQAELGDPSVLAAFYDSDCDWYRAETAR